MRAALWLCVFSLCGAAQDLRNVTEPVIPPACATLNSQLSVEEGKLREDEERMLDTARIRRPSIPAPPVIPWS